MAIDKYLNAGNLRRNIEAPAPAANGHGTSSNRPSNLVIEADRTLSVCTDNKQQPLGISPPRAGHGESLRITVENIPPPAIAYICRADGSKVNCGDTLSCDELAHLVYTSRHNAIPGTPPGFAYSVTSSSGETGRQALRFRLVETKVNTILLAPSRL